MLLKMQEMGFSWPSVTHVSLVVAGRLVHFIAKGVNLRYLGNGNNTRVLDILLRSA